MPLAADYPFLEVLYTLLIFFVWVAFFWLLITVAIDVFRRRDIGGGKKALWLIFMLFIPFVGVFAYLIVNHDEMAQRNLDQAKAQQAQFDDYVKATAGAGGAASEIDKAKQLLDSGAITAAEFDAIKQRALA